MDGQMPPSMDEALLMQASGACNSKLSTINLQSSTTSREPSTIHHKP